MEKNIVIQGELTSIVQKGSYYIEYTIMVARKQELVDPDRPDTYKEYNRKAREHNRKADSIHLGTASIGQGVTAYHELEKA